MTHVALPGWFSFVVVGLLAAAILLAMTRLVVGPELPDRVVAFEVMAMGVLGSLAWATVAYEELAILDAGLVLALVAFVATVGFARFILVRGSGGGGS